MSTYTRITVWTEGQILTASDLNTEENNHILNGPPNHASQHASGAVDDIKAYYLSLASGGTVAAPLTMTSRINENKGADIAAATTMNIGAATGNFIDITGDKGTVTMTMASPAVFSKTAHGLVLNDTVVFTTTGALYTGLTAGTVYFVISAGLTADAFEVSATQGGAAVNTSGSQSGTHSVQRAITAFDTVQAGAERALRFNGQLTIVHDGTKMILPGAVNVTTASGQIIVFRSLGSGNWICSSPAFSATHAANVVPVGAGVIGEVSTKSTTQTTTLDMGTVKIGDRFLLTAYSATTYTGGPITANDATIYKGSGTATIVMLQDKAQIYYSQAIITTSTTGGTCSVIVEVTGDGTLVMSNLIHLGGASPSSWECQMYACFLKKL